MRHLLALCGLGILTSCNQSSGGAANGARSEAVASASQEMSGPSLFSSDVLTPALQTLRSKADGKWLRLEVKPREIVLQAEDPGNPGAVLEYHYRDGKLGEPEHAVLRAKGELADNLFELSEVRLDAIPKLTREAVRRVDAEHGRVERVLVRRNLPESSDVRLRVYVQSPRWSGHLDADNTGQPL
jgi:hypothetical protein